MKKRVFFFASASTLVLVYASACAHAEREAAPAGATPAKAAEGACGEGCCGDACCGGMIADALGAVAAADGAPTAVEVAAVRVGVRAVTGRDATVDDAPDTMTVERFAKQLARAASAMEPEQLSRFMSAIRAVAEADGTVTTEEHTLINASATR